MNSLNNALNNYYLTLTGPIIILALVIFAWARVGTIISLLLRIWRLIVGRVEANDEKLVKFNRDMCDIEQFNFVYGLKVKSIEKMHEIIGWIEKYKLGYVDIWYAKKWLDLSNLKINLPPKNYVNWRVTGLGICGLIFFWCNIAFHSSSALLQFKESKTWFYLDQKRAEGFMSDWVLEANQCNASDYKPSVQTLTKNEFDILCKTLKDKSLTVFLKEDIHNQKILVCIIFFGTLIWLFILILQIISYQSAKVIDNSLNATSE